MRSVLNKLGLAILGLLLCAGTSHAATIGLEFVDTFTPTAAVTLEGTAYPYSHDITPPSITAQNSLVASLDGVPTAGEGYLPTDTLTGGSLTLNFKGTSAGSVSKNYSILLDGTDTFTGNLGNGNQVVLIDGASFEVAWISSAGLLSVALTRTNPTEGGTLQFLSSVLKVTGTRTLEDEQPPVSTVPEPASLLLLGTGLIGAAARMRSRRRNKK